MPKKVKANPTTVKGYVKHQAKRGYKYLKKRYYDKEAGTVNMRTILSDVAMLKGIINVEKKRWNYLPASAGALGQVNGNGSGHICEDVTPTLSQGVGEAYRIGNSVKISGIYGKLQMRNGGSQTAPVRFIVELISVKGDPYTSMTTFISDYLQANAFVSTYSAVSIYDWFSPRNQQNMKKFKRLVYKVVTMKPDSVSGQNQQAECTLKCKPNLHLKWEADANTTPNLGQIILLVRCDRGNYSPGTVSTLSGISDTAVSTGYAFDRNLQFYIIDN